MEVGEKNNTLKCNLCCFLGGINNEITSESVAKHKCQLITDGTWGRDAGTVRGSVGGEVEQVLRMAFNNKIQYIKTKAATRNLNSASNRSRSRPGKNTYTPHGAAGFNWKTGSAAPKCFCVCVRTHTYACAREMPVPLNHTSVKPHPPQGFTLLTSVA